MSKMTAERLPVSRLTVDRKVQRTSLQMGKVEKIVKNYNDAAVGVATVSRRADGEEVVLDGMHRVEAIRRITTNTGEIDCHVYEGLTFAQEAQMFLDLNYSNQPTVMDKFRVRVTAGDPVAVYIDQLLASYGWKIDNGRRKGNIQCVAKLETIYLKGVADEDETLLADVILVITRAWGDDDSAGQAAILDGIAAVFTEYGDSVDIARLYEHLRDYRGGPRGLMSDAEQLAGIERMRTSMAVARRVVDTYNKGLKTNALYAWRRNR